MAEIAVKTIGEDGTFEDVIAEAPEATKEIAYGLRALLAEIMPGITEVPWAHQKTVGYGVGPRKMSEHFCYIAPQKDYVNLGFMYGTDLPDPQGLLEGSGKSLRHIKIRTLEDVERPAVRKLVEAASVHLPKLKR
jgi:hypothetical protein